MGNIRISKIDSDLEFDWSNVFDVVTDVGVHGLASMWGQTPSVGHISSFLKSARKSVKVSEPIESTAFRLVLLCFASAIDDLRPLTSDIDILKTARKTVEKTKAIVEADTYYLTDKFFDNPVSLPLYQAVREIFIEGLGKLWPKSQNIGGKLDSAFNSALYKIIRQEPEFGTLFNTLSGLGSPASTLEDDWRGYRQHLIHSFEVRPVFGQDDSHISLSQIYIKPRAIWTETKTDPNGNTFRLDHLVDLTSHMEMWIKERDPLRCIRLLRGGPGSGKSSFAKAICSSLAANDNYRPLLIELQHLQGVGTLAEKTSRLFVEHEEQFSIDPLNKQHLDDNRPIILVFDGLDELVIPNSSGANKIAEDLWDDLDELLAKFNTIKKVRVFAFVTGRDPIIQAAMNSRRGRKFDKRDALKIIGLESLDADELASHKDVPLEDQREEWWTKYALATGGNSTCPPIITSPELSSLTQEPLLCYLIALSGKAEESRTKEITNINDIYEKLISDVWHRVWGDLPDTMHANDESIKADYRRNGPISAFKHQDEFEIILEYIAIAAWRGGESRSASLTGFESAILQTQAEDIWHSFNKEFEGQQDEESFSTLALTFFFRKQDLESRGFEFTHRSFGEYLAARAICRFLDSNMDRYQKIRSVSDLSEWLKFTGPVPVTREILVFLKNEMRRKPIEHLQLLQQALKKCMALTLASGMPVRVGDQDNWRSAEKRQQNSEGLLLSTLSAVTVSLLEKDPDSEIVDLEFDVLSTGRSLIERLEIRNEFGNSLYSHSLAGFVFSRTNNSADANYRLDPNNHYRKQQANYGFLSLFICDFSYSDFSGANLSASTIGLSKFKNSNLTNVDLRYSFSFDIDFTSCELTGTDFKSSRLNNSDFSDLILALLRFVE